MGEWSPLDRIRWTTISVHMNSDEAALEGDVRLAALFRWLRVEAPPDLVVRDPEGEVIADPMSVNWDRFPIQQAIDAVHRVGHLLPLSR